MAYAHEISQNQLSWIRSPQFFVVSGWLTGNFPEIRQDMRREAFIKRSIKDSLLLAAGHRERIWDSIDSLPNCFTLKRPSSLW